MGNIFTNRKAGTRLLQISNLGTDAFFDVLLLSASQLADSDWEKSFAMWLAGKDQDILGSGTVGFDVSEIAWTKESFEIEKAFIMRTIEAAINEMGWDKLGYKPNIKEKLKTFLQLIDAYQKEFIENEEWGVSLFELGNKFQICPIHHIYMHNQQDNCRICNAIIFS